MRSSGGRLKRLRAAWPSTTAPCRPRSRRRGHGARIRRERGAGSTKTSLHSRSPSRRARPRDRGLRPRTAATRPARPLAQLDRRGRRGVARQDQRRVREAQYLGTGGVRSCESSTTRSGRRRAARTPGRERSASVVGQHGSAAGHDRRGARPQPLHVGPRPLAGDPLAGAVGERGRPSRLAPSFKVTQGRPVRMRRTKPRFNSVASPASSPAAVTMPAASRRASPTRPPRIRVAHRHDDAPHTRRDQGSVHGGVRLGANRARA